MNKYREALAQIKHCECDGCVCDDLKLIEQIVERAIPKKIAKQKPLKEDVTIGSITFKKGTSILKICPVCGNWLHPFYHKKYCGNCGQRLDWSK